MGRPLVARPPESWPESWPEDWSEDWPEGRPESWPAYWSRADTFLASAPIAPELRDWLAPGVVDGGQSLVWWAAAPRTAAPRIAAPRTGEPVADPEAGFALIYHPAALQFGFFLSGRLRGQGWGARALQRALGQLPEDGAPLALAQVARSNHAACRTLTACGLRLLAEQKARVVFCLDRPMRQSRRACAGM
ncbi:hypothetical protein [Thioclava sp. GXIMD4216]|uniref:hypothetical protein n=1 Tax=Thioclava sp. GXIMD4216 TaxID=3131929 RepID=UPI0030D43C47